MEEYRITFDTAKLAKEKGFNVTTKLIGSHHHFYKNNREILIGDSYDKHLVYYRCSQSLLQKWLREVFNIYVNCWNNPKNLLYKYEIFYKDTYIESLQNMNYEEALEEGLKEALKLI